MADNRLARELENRDATARKKAWTPPQLLPEPKPIPGWKFKYVRISSMGIADPTNTSAKLREGWEPVKASDHPEVHLVITEEGRFKDNIVVGGLMLCKIPTELVLQRDAYYNGHAESQMNSVDNNFMRENDPRMPLFNERKTKVTFGSGS